MNTQRKIAVLTLAAMCINTSGAVFAADLTVFGAEKNANSDGSIPAYDGSNSIQSGWTYGKNRGDSWKYKDEKPLLTINAANADQYKDKLTPGQYEILKQVPSYTMQVFPTHRDCVVPKFVQENTKTNAGKASIGSDGWSLENAVLPSVPFPEPKTGIEAMWNFLTRYQGIGVDWKAGYSVVSAHPGNTDRIKVRWTQLLYYPWAKENQTQQVQDGGVLNGLYYSYQQPAALAGQALIGHTYFKNDGDSYYYFTGQRRVRRLPSYEYDAPQIGFENQYTTDQPLLFVGLPDRFDWKLLGKKEIYVPYNSFGASNANMPLDEATQDRFINPAVRRYELHRVWVVQGTVKDGVRHSMPKKTLYLDEDSWIAVAGDDYDPQGKIWKAKEMYSMPIAELGGACAGQQFVMYDVNSGRYLSDELVWGTGKDIKYYAEPNGDPRLNDNYFTSENLERQSAQ